MDAIIAICTVEKEFRQDQTAIMKRVVRVLEAHDLSVEIVIKRKRTRKNVMQVLRAV